MIQQINIGYLRAAIIKCYILSKIAKSSMRILKKVILVLKLHLFLKNYNRIALEINKK